MSAILAEPHRLTTFTIAAANDTPERDPRVWEIEGSEDGVNFTTSFRQDNPTTSIFTARLQVIQFIAGVHFPEPPPYTMIRFICFATGLTTGARSQLAELEFFGEPGPGVPPRITDVTLDDDSFDITWNSKPGRFHRVE